MTERVTEYQEEYCGMRMPGAEEEPTIYDRVNADHIKQPVGGRVQHRAREAALERVAAGRQNIYDPSHESYLDGALPNIDQRHIASSYKASQRGTHRVAPNWHDHRWSDVTRIDSATLYDPRLRDPPSRNNYNLYKTAMVDPRDTPCDPLAVPDVHKLRYMQNEYMTSDDWY